jgi:hypothetical protein
VNTVAAIRFQQHREQIAVATTGALCPTSFNHPIHQAVYRAKCPAESAIACSRDESWCDYKVIQRVIEVPEYLDHRLPKTFRLVAESLAEQSPSDHIERQP